MGMSIGIFKIEKFELLEKIKQEGQITVMSKKTLADFDDEFGLPSPSSTIKLVNETKNRVIYAAEHYSDTIEKPIRTWKKHLFTDAGYQEFIKIQIIHDLNRNELYIVAKKDVVDAFASRLKMLKELIKIEKCTFNLNIIKAQEILNVYGIWDKCHKGNITVEAKFGSDVLESIQATDSTIAINMKVKQDDKEFDVTLSSDGQISSHSNVSFGELMNFFEVLRPELLG